MQTGQHRCSAAEQQETLLFRSLLSLLFLRCYPAVARVT